MSWQLFIATILTVLLAGVYAWSGTRTTSSGAILAPDAKPLDWVKLPQTVATQGHWLGGFVLLFVPTFWSGGSWDVLGVLTGIVVVGIPIKEYVFDLRDESDEDVYSSTMDLAGWLFGVVVAWTNTLIAYHVGRW